MSLNKRSLLKVTELTLLFPQMFSQLRPGTLWVLLLLCIPAALASKCPQQCVCDQIQLTVTCVNRNLTQVPPAVDEVSCSHRFLQRVFIIWLHPTRDLLSSSFADHSEVRSPRQRHPGASHRGLQTHSLSDSPVAAAL